MARHAPPSDLHEFGVSFRLSQLPDALTGGLLLNPRMFQGPDGSADDNNQVKDTVVFFMGTDTNGWPIMTSEASVLMHLASINDTIAKHTDTSNVDDEMHHRDAILAMSHVRGLVWRFNKYGATLRFGFQHNYKFHFMTWYAELEMHNQVAIPYIQEFAIVSMLTRTTVFDVAAVSMSTTTDINYVHRNTLRTITSRAQQCAKKFEHGSLRFYVFSDLVTTNTVTFKVAMHWSPSISDSDEIGQHLENEEVSLQTLFRAQHNPMMKMKNAAPSTAMFADRVRESTRAIQGCMEFLLDSAGGMGAYSGISQMNAVLDDTNTFFHTTIARDDMVHVFINARPLILATTFFAVGFPSYRLYQMTGPVQGGMFPAHFADEEETSATFGARHKEVKALAIT